MGAGDRFHYPISLTASSCCVCCPCHASKTPESLQQPYVLTCGSFAAHGLTVWKTSSGVCMSCVKCCVIRRHTGCPRRLERLRNQHAQSYADIFLNQFREMYSVTLSRMEWGWSEVVKIHELLQVDLNFYRTRNSLSNFY